MKLEMVVKRKKIIRSYWLTIRLDIDEETTLRALYAKTKEASLSSYVRKVLLQKPVIVRYRNASADDFLFHMLGLKNELNAIGINLNQSVHKLHTLDRYSDIKAWTKQHEATKNAFLQKADDISQKLSQIHELWLQK